MKKLLFIPLLFLCCVSYADPIVTSLSSDVISGSGFSTKTSANPKVFDTFTRSTINTTADIGSWQSTTNLTISGGVATYNFDGSVGGDAYLTGRNDILSLKWFAQYKFKLADDWDWGTTDYSGNDKFLSNIKIFRMWNPGDINENFVMATQGWDNSMIYTTENVSSPGGGYFVGGIGGQGYQTAWTKGVWHTLQFEFAESGVEENNGVIRVWFNGRLILNDTDIKTREDFDELKRPLIIGFYNSWSWGEGDNPDLSPNAPNGFFMDDVYVDTTWQRVEVGDNSVYGSCTHREIQIPTAWSDTEITVTWNQGSFANSETCYLFVIDADGTASAGLEGTFVDGTFYSDAVPPTSSGTITWGSGSEAITITYGAGSETITIK